MNLFSWLKLVPKIRRAKEEFQEKGVNMQLKPGRKSSEFFMVLLGIIVTAVYPAIKDVYAIPESYLMLIDGLIAIYTGGRSFVKGKLVEGVTTLEQTVS